MEDLSPADLNQRKEWLLMGAFMQNITQVIVPFLANLAKQLITNLNFTGHSSGVIVDLLQTYQG